MTLPCWVRDTTLLNGGADPVWSMTKPNQKGARLTIFVVLWLLWSCLFSSLAIDLFVASLTEVTPTEADAKLINVFAITDFFALGFAVFLTWLFFSFLIHPTRLRIERWTGAAVAFGGALIVWAICKSIETHGFILFLQSNSWRAYLPFVAVSALSFLILNPHFLLTRGKKAQQ